MAWEQVNVLSEERQKLWKIARKQRLTKGQRERLADIGKQLERAWHQHRSLIAFAARGRVFIEDRLRSEWFVDYLERLHMGVQPEPDTYEQEVRADEIRMGSEQDCPPEEEPNVFEDAPARGHGATWAESAKLGEIDVIIAEVLAELNAADSVQASA